MSKQENKDNKLRVYEYAKSLNMSSKEIITILKRLDIPVNNHMSVMENDTVSKVEQFFKDIKSSAAAKRDTAEASRGDSRKSASVASSQATTGGGQGGATTVRSGDGNGSQRSQSRGQGQQPKTTGKAGRYE